MQRTRKIVLSIISILMLITSFFVGIYFQKYKMEHTKPMNDLGISISEEILKAIDKGDKRAYRNLVITYLDYPTQDFLPIAMEMANKQNYPPAYYDVYSTLTVMENLDEENDSISEWENWNPRMRRIALEYLLIGAKFGDEQSIETIKEYYKENKRLNKILYRNEDLVIQYSETIKSIK